MDRFDAACQHATEVFMHVDFGEPNIVGIVEVPQQVPEAVEALRTVAGRLGMRLTPVRPAVLACGTSQISFIDGPRLAGWGHPRCGLVDFRFHLFGHYPDLQQEIATTSTYTDPPWPP